MRWTQRFFALGLALALSATVSCTTSDGPTGLPVSEPVEQQPSYLLGDLLAGDGSIGDVVDGTVSTLLNVTDLLVCSAQPYEVVRKTIGSDGGTISVGTHTLVIPKGALRKTTTITAEQMRGSTNSLRFSPEGLRFQKPAALTMSYKNCLVVLLPKRIVYTTEQFKILEVLRSLDLFQKKKVTAPIDHFSRYAIAY
ncbi:MAG TPA: hypothetical protein VFS51_04475 [Gemmatimonadales bacterium]|nr:hypothetical protein [Gemmatimonadales bacterium]